jgi:hypothetical protein
VATELQSFRVQIDADARLAAAVGGVARFLGDTARLEETATAQLQSSVVAACIEVFQYLTGMHPHLRVTLARFSDRIEVALSHHGDASPALGLDSIAGLASQAGGRKGGANPFVGVDRVQFETHGGEAVTRLTKYIGKASSGT